MTLSRLCMLAAVMTLACHDPDEPPAVLSFTLAPRHQWSGGTVVAVSRGLAGGATLPVFLAGSDTLSAVRIDDSTAAITLPIVASGPLLLSARRGGYTDTVGTVQVYGHSARADLTPAPEGTLVLGWNGTNPMFLGSHNSGDTIVVVDPVASTSTLLSSLRNPGLYYGAGVTYRPDRFLLRDASDTLKVWQLWPVPSMTGLPVAHLTGFVRLAAQMTDSTWLFAAGTYAETFGPARLSGLLVEDPWNLFISPRGDRLALTMVGTNLPGAPVFDTRTGDTAYTIVPVKWVSWADFSPDGSELYVLGGPGSGADSLLVVDATTGGRRRSAPAPGGGFLALTVTIDPVADLLYMQGYADCGPTVVVYSASTLERLGQMRGEGAVSSCNNGGWSGIVAADRTRNELYVLWNGGPLWTFALMP